jgi:hypothetical protein
MIPTTFVDRNNWGIPEGLMLADENFNSPNSNDILLGAVFFLEFCVTIRRHSQEITQSYRTQQ